MWKYLDDMIIVSDNKLEYVIYILLDTIHQIAEGAVAASTTAAIKLKEVIKDKKVVLTLTGGNITTTILMEMLNKYAKY